jgi:hypothetical protein
MVTAFSDGTNVLPPAETCTVHLRQYRRNRSKSLLSTFPRAALGANSSQFEKRGATNMEYLRATSDNEMGKIGRGPSGCDENQAILRCHPRLWTRHRLRTPPRLARFSSATPPARKLIAGSEVHLDAMRVFGIDCGTEVTGFGVVDSGEGPRDEPCSFVRWARSA